MSHSQRVFYDSFKKLSQNWLRGGSKFVLTHSEPGRVPHSLGKHVRGSLTMHGNVWRSLPPGFFAKSSFWLTALVGGGEGVKLGWNRWWENAARYSQLLRLITCCPQRWSSCHSSVITSDCFWKPDTCHEGNLVPEWGVNIWCWFIVVLCIMIPSNSFICMLTPDNLSPWGEAIWGNMQLRAFMVG